MEQEKDIKEFVDNLLKSMSMEFMEIVLKSKYLEENRLRNIYPELPILKENIIISDKELEFLKDNIEGFNDSYLNDGIFYGIINTMCKDQFSLLDIIKIIKLICDIIRKQNDTIVFKDLNLKNLNINKK